MEDLRIQGQGLDLRGKAKDFKMCPRGRPQGQGRPRKLHLCLLDIEKARRVARIWKRGGYFERVRGVQTTLTGIFIDLEAVSDGLSENSGEMSRKARKFKGFFSPKLGEIR